MELHENKHKISYLSEKETGLENVSYISYLPNEYIVFEFIDNSVLEIFHINITKVNIERLHVHKIILPLTTDGVNKIHNTLYQCILTQGFVGFFCVK